MIAKFENVFHNVPTEIWAGKYKNLTILPHWHLDHEIIHCESGKIYVTLNGQAVTLLPGDSIYCYSRDIHEISSERGSINAMIVFSPFKLPRNFPNTHLQNPIIRDDAMFHQAFDAIYREINELPPYYEEFSYAVLCKYLLLLIRSHSHAETDEKGYLRRAMGQKKLLEILTTTSAYITFQDAAKKMGYSESYFSRYFKSIFGVTFSQYMNAIKTADAIMLINGNPELTVTQIAANCGFNTIRHFNRIFKEFTGVSPSDFAKINIGNSAPSIQIGKHFDPTIKSSIRIDYFKDMGVQR